MIAPNSSIAGSPYRRDKLGLSLAGGGFRASLFHAGVLRRLAELDVLRHIEVLSTVSGGSIVGALYYLLLKREIDRKGNLTRDDYMTIVQEMQELLLKAIRLNLRTRLLWNPLGVLRVLLTEHSLGKRMARLYERYLYRRIVDQILPHRSWWERLSRPGRIGIVNLQFEPDGGGVAGGLENYNVAAGQRGHSRILNLILNATSLNSGRPFRFSIIELGDSKLGFFRHDEVKSQLLPRKELVQHWPFAKLLESAKAGRDIEVQGYKLSANTVRFAAWWRILREKRETQVEWRPRNNLFRLEGFPGNLPQAEFGPLRRAKLAAWYLLRGPAMEPPVTGGVPPEVHRVRFRNALHQIDDELASRVSFEARQNSALEQEVMEFVLELYYLRSAEVMSRKISRDWERLSLGDAVGASACFPPVFPPLIMLGFYDDLWVTRLGLTDGGAYDNLGITSLFEEDCTYIITSDTSGLFEPAQRASHGRMKMMGRLSSILMNHVAELQRAGLRERHNVTRVIDSATSSPDLAELQAAYNLQGLASFHINSLPPQWPGFRTEIDRNIIARLRTDLDAFGEIEIAALINQGYLTADHYVRRYLSDSPYNNNSPDWQAPGPLPIPPRADATNVERILTIGSSRFFRALKLSCPISWTFSIALSALAVLMTWNLRGSLRTVTVWLAGKSADYIDTLATGFRMGWVDVALPLGGLVLILIGLTAAGLAIRKWLIRMAVRFPAIVRPVLSAFKWVRSWWANILWLLNLTPIWIALLISVAAAISYVCYNLPFLARTRNE